MQKWPTPPLPNSSGSSRKHRFPKENVPPPDPYTSPSAATKHKSSLSPRPPNSKHKSPTGSETAVSGSSGSGVKKFAEIGAIRLQRQTQGTEDHSCSSRVPGYFRLMWITGSPSGNNTTPVGPCRYDSSLGLLTKKFINLIKHEEDGILDLNNAADTLEVSIISLLVSYMCPTDFY
nr:transcription factor E2FB-like [Ipomoea batatas]